METLEKILVLEIHEKILVLEILEKILVLAKKKRKRNLETQEKI